MEEEKKNTLKEVKEEFDKKEVEEGKAMAILCYIGFLVFIPFFVEKKNKFVRFHAKQGMNLLILSGILAAGLLTINAILFWFLWWFSGLLNFAVSGGIIALSVMGIVSAAQGKAKELPVINKFKIIK